MKSIECNSLDTANMYHHLCCKFRVMDKSLMLYRYSQIGKSREGTYIDLWVFSWTWGHSCSMERCHSRLQSKKSDRNKMCTSSHLYRLSRNLNRANKYCSKCKCLLGIKPVLRIIHPKIVSLPDKSIYPTKDWTRTCMKGITRFLLRTKYSYRRKVQLLRLHRNRSIKLVRNCRHNYRLLKWMKNCKQYIPRSH